MNAAPDRIEAIAATGLALLGAKHSEGVSQALGVTLVDLLHRLERIELDTAAEKG